VALKIPVINGVDNCGRIGDSLGHGEHIYSYVVSKCFTVLLISKMRSGEGINI